MEDSAPDFEWYDAWILASIIYASAEETPVPLWRVVGIADALNKAIVSRSELELGLGRLIAAGYVRVVDGGFEPTSAALELKAPGHPLDNVASGIGAKPWSRSAEEPRTTTEIYVSADAYRKAVRRYRKEFWKKRRTKR